MAAGATATVLDRMMQLSPRMLAFTNAPAARILCWPASGQLRKVDAGTGS